MAKSNLLTESAQYGTTQFASIGKNDYAWVKTKGVSCPSPVFQLGYNTQCINNNVKFSTDVDSILASLEAL